MVLQRVYDEDQVMLISYHKQGWLLPQSSSGEAKTTKFGIVVSTIFCGNPSMLLRTV